MGTWIMKKIGQSKSLNLVISLLLTLLLFAYVISTKSATSSGNGGNNITNIVPEKKAVLKVPLSLQYDNDEYVAVGAPASVQVTIEGSGALISAARSRNDIQASADLRGLKPGKHTVTVALRGVNASLTSTVEPQKVTVTIAKKATTTLPVTVDYDKNKIASGYTVSNATSDPKRVTIIGPQTNVDSVASVIARPSLQSGIKDSIAQNTQLIALDKEGNEVEVAFNHKTVNVELTVAPEDSKKLSLKANIKNGDANQYQVSFDPKTITAYGASDTLNSLNDISLNIDLNDIKDQNGTIKIDLPKIDGVVRYDTSTVTANITKNSTSDASKESSSSSSNNTESSSKSSSSTSDSSSSSK